MIRLRPYKFCIEWKDGVCGLRLDIIGSVASGKTTLAKRISQRFNTPYYEKDNVVWKRTSSGDEKRSPEERDRCFNEIINKKDWIV